MTLVPYFIHPQVLQVCEYNKLECFNMEKYIFDDIHENHEYLQSLDPRDWKEQDHYAVLRIKKIRINASQELIKQAYRKQLLDHHPDKGRQRLRKCDDENNDYFTCITKAFDLLKDPVFRISYDSVDPEFDDEIPTLRDAKDNFFKSFGPVFQRNARWSKIQPVPLLGDADTPIEEVHRFYAFWDGFSSWREFSYLDKESKSQADCREERRFIDKENKGERKKKSSEECRRINSLVDLSKSQDPRVIKYNTQRKAEKEEEKKARASRKLEKKLAAERTLKEEKERLEQEEAERQQKLKDEMNNLKKQKDVIKNKQKIEKRKLRKLTENYNYFIETLSNNNPTKSIDMQKAEMINIIDVLCLKMQIDDLIQLNEELENATEVEMITIIKKTEEKLTGKNTEISKPPDPKPNGVNSEMLGFLNKCGDKEWTFELTQFLIKAINCHPPGTNHRWHAIAEYMNIHHKGLNVKEKQVVQKAKLLKTDDSVLKKEAAAHNFVTKADLTIKEGMKTVDNNNASKSEAVVETKPTWSLEEQKLLEMALKSIPSSDSSRWDRISEMVATKSKKECILRFKECAEKMKAKKAAQ